MNDFITIEERWCKRGEVIIKSTRIHGTNHWIDEVWHGKEAPIIILDSGQLRGDWTVVSRTTTKEQ
jgi:hypothetical protein